MPFVCHNPPDPVRCPNCKRALIDPAFAARMERAHVNALNTKPTSQKSKYAHLVGTQPKRHPLCIHRGSPQPPPDGNPTNKTWVKCDHPSAPLGNPVCACHGCGPNCPGYDADDPSPPTPPKDYPVVVAIPHLGTLPQLKLALDLWRLQTASPYLIVVDTGSDGPTCRELEKLRRPDCEVHFLQRKTYRHASGCVAVALDLAQSVCPTKHLFHTHTDVFPVRRDFLEWMIPQVTEASPVAGWRMSPRSHGPWRECVSHTATMVHIPSVRKHRLQWNLDAYLETYPNEEHRPGWPDTESGFWLSMQAVKISPVILGDEINLHRQTTEWWDHSRSYTGLKLASRGEHWQRAKRQMDEAESDARQRLSEWSQGSEIPVT